MKTIKFIRHLVADMVGPVQKCELCGEIITDYRGAMFPICDVPPPRGFAEGDVFISETTNPKLFFITEPTADSYPDLEVIVEDCTKIKIQ